MNTLLMIAGLVLFATGLIRIGLNLPARPRHGDIQIRQEGEIYWLYKYVSVPGWTLHKRAHSLEEARDIKDREERKPRSVEKVVE